jgi:outer membrane receptor protein involved in Fe transport
MWFSNTITDLRMSYAYNDQVQLYGYIKNVFDERTTTCMQTAASAASRPA